MPPGSPNPDPISDQKMSFSDRFSDLGYLPFNNNNNNQLYLTRVTRDSTSTE